jgi:hypothetical protein
LLTPRTWRRKQYVSPKRRWMSTGLHGFSSKKIGVRFKLWTVRMASQFWPTPSGASPWIRSINALLQR